MPAITVGYYKLSEDGSEVVDTASVSNGTIRSLESLGWSAPDGYLFVEWNTAYDGSGTSYSAGDVTTSSINLYTIWTKPAVNKVILGSETLIDLTADTATAADVAAGATLHLSNGERATGTATYAGAPENNGNANRSNAILYGAVDSTSTDTAFTATVDGLTELVDGTTVMLKNGVVTSASGFTLNVNGLGAKPVYTNLAAATRDTTIFNVNYTMLFVYDSTRVEGGGWICYRGYDANTNTIGYQLRTNSGNMVASDTGYRYRLWLTQADGKKWVPINTSTSTNGTSARTLNTRPIDPFGRIAYRSTNGTCTAGTGVGATAMWDVYTCTIGYSYVLSLTAQNPVYLRCNPQSNGSAVMEVLTQTLPTSKDGKIYIHLGIAYSATAMELDANHPVYWHDGTGIRLWTGAEGSTSITIDQEPTSGSNNAVSSGGIYHLLRVVPGENYDTCEYGRSADLLNLVGDSGHRPTYNSSNQVAYLSDVSSKQDALVSGTNIKTVNGNSLLGSGDITISGGGGGGRTNWYGKCTTAASAATKVVECAGFTLEAGATVTVYMQTGNSYEDALYLNVNSTGAKRIKFHGVVSDEMNPITILALSTVTFMYDGTYWEIVSDIAANYMLFSGKIESSRIYGLPSASTTAPSMDGTASYGSGTDYARANHVHPTDTSRQATLVSGTNIKTINGNSILGSGDLTISGGSGGASYTTQAVSIPTSAWSGTTATVSALAVTATNDVIVAPAPTSIAAWAAAGVYCSAQGAGTLTFTCSTVPTAALTANVMAFEGGNA